MCHGVAQGGKRKIIKMVNKAQLTEWYTQKHFVQSNAYIVQHPNKKKTQNHPHFVQLSRQSPVGINTTVAHRPSKEQCYSAKSALDLANKSVLCAKPAGTADLQVSKATSLPQAVGYKT